MLGLSSLREFGFLAAFACSIEIAASGQILVSQCGVRNSHSYTSQRGNDGRGLSRERSELSLRKD